MVKQMVEMIAQAQADRLEAAWKYEHDKALDETYSPDWNPYTDEQTLTHLLTAKVLDRHYIMKELPETMEYEAIRVCLLRDRGGPTVWLDTSRHCVEAEWHQSIARCPVPPHVVDWVDDSYADWLGKVRKEIGE